MISRTPHTTWARSPRANSHSSLAVLTRFKLGTSPNLWCGHHHRVFGCVRKTDTAWIIATVHIHRREYMEVVQPLCPAKERWPLRVQICALRYDATRRGGGAVTSSDPWRREEDQTTIGTPWRREGRV